MTKLKNEGPMACADVSVSGEGIGLPGQLFINRQRGQCACHLKRQREKIMDIVINVFCLAVSFTISSYENFFLAVQSAAGRVPWPHSEPSEGMTPPPDKETPHLSRLTNQLS